VGIIPKEPVSAGTFPSPRSTLDHLYDEKVSRLCLSVCSEQAPYSRIGLIHTLQRLMEALNGCSELSWIDLERLGRAMGLCQSNASRLTDSNERMPLVFSACVALFSAVNTPDQHFWPTPRAMPFIDIPGYAITSRPIPPLRFACQHHPQQLESSYNFPLTITSKFLLCRT